MTDSASILTIANLLDHFPWDQHPTMRANQRTALEHIASIDGSVVIEAPTGSGKTAIGLAVLQTLADADQGPLFYIAPNKTQVDQVAEMYPAITRVYGRNEYDCLYYGEDSGLKADEIPCMSLVDCPHRVNQETGETFELGATPCPYFQAKFEAKQAKIVVCTVSFYLFTQLFSREWERPAGLVIDEVHQIAKVFRGALSYEVTDWHLRQSINLLRKLGAENEAEGLATFLQAMTGVLRRKPQSQPTLLKDEEISLLLSLLLRVDTDKVQAKITEGIRTGAIDPLADRVLLKHLETIAYDLRRYVHSLDYSLADNKRHALNYVTYAYSAGPPEGEKQVQYRLIVRAYHVAPLVRKLMSPVTVALSATIGDPEIFGFETGIKAPFLSLPSDFPNIHAINVMPTDTPDLSAAKRSRHEPAKVLRRIARASARLAEHGVRSLVIVVSNSERDRLVRVCEEEGVEYVTYGAESTPRQAVARFKAGEGMVLIGTVANYGEGIDLPEEMAPVTFFLRPGYPSPADPATQFEERRFGGQRWAVWKWRAMIEALQVRGRNIRSAEDRGVTIFVSQQFRSFLYGSLPLWLRESYRNDLKLEEAVEAALDLLEPV